MLQKSEPPAMNVEITSFENPFSFYFTTDNHSIFNDISENIEAEYDPGITLKTMDAEHGKYVAVLWKKQWVRGVISTETKLSIWLIDYGISLCPDEKTVYVKLPQEYKKYPSKVIEASLHGVVPMDKILSPDCLIQNVIGDEWNNGAIEKARQLINEAKKINFVPVALLCTKNNDVVLGDLHIETIDGVVDIVDELSLWPVFLERNKEAYIQKLPKFYTNHRRHYACPLKPLGTEELPTITLNTSLVEYSAICEKMCPFQQEEKVATMSLACSTVVGSEFNFKKKQYKLTETEMQEYSTMYWEINGRRYNVLNTLLNKIKTIKICERYKDHDGKSVGRANSYRKMKL